MKLCNASLQQMRKNTTSGIEKAFQELWCSAENSLPTDCKAVQQCRRKEKAIDIKPNQALITNNQETTQ